VVPSTSLIPIRDDNPTRTFPALTVALIAINVIVWLAQVSQATGAAAAEAFFYRWGVVPIELTTDAVMSGPACGGPCKVGPPSYAILTAMFVHAGFIHLAGNMLFLWVFGNNVEDTLGKPGFVAFYLGCGVAATLAHVALDPTSQLPTVGASGAVAGLLGAYIVLFPHARVTTIIPIFIFLQFIRLPAVVVLGYWFVYQFFIGVMQSNSTGGGVAWVAHVGGFVTGAVLMYGYRQLRGVRPPPPPPPQLPAW
jgi:membrane associated rhomboid family serine protease